MATKKSQKVAQTFYCNICDYTCSRKNDYNKHISTRKHLMATSGNSWQHEKSQYCCDYCNKKYQDRTGLYKHKQKCKMTYTADENNQTTIEPNSADLMVLVKELMVQMAAKDKHQEELIKQNAELQNTMREMIPHIGNNNNTNSHNTFNIQMFLENECKNAISIQDFIKSIEINMSHLVAISKDGYVDSISNVLIQALNQLAITDRPLHCTDLKREIIYIKDDAKWNKSTADAKQMSDVINSIENKHFEQIKQYVREHPQSQILDTPEYNFYNKACMNSLGNCEDHDKLNKKICKKVLPEVKLDKTNAS